MLAEDEKHMVQEVERKTHFLASLKTENLNRVHTLDYQRKTKRTQVLDQYSFDRRIRLWNTILGITWKIIMAELIVAASALGLGIIRRRRKREKSSLFTIITSTHTHTTLIR